MLDFVEIRQTEKKTNEITVWPDFITYKSKDLMIRGGGFYAVWVEEENLWSTSAYKARELIDRETLEACNEIKDKRPNANVKPLLLKYDSSGRAKAWLAYTKSLPDNYHPLDENVVFNNTATTKESYASHKLPYDLVDGDCKSYNEIVSTLYEPKEREKLEWAVGSIIKGDSKSLQKFIVLYGDKGTGKSTVLNIYQALLDGYWSVFTAKDLARSNAEFALESFKTNPLMAIQHDGDLSRIEDNTKLNSIISHEPIEINEKHKGKYMMKLNSFLFMGTNHPVKITDSKSGILRRLIDVSPSEKLIPEDRYFFLIGNIKYELGPIAYHCLSVYEELGKNYYAKYKPMSMMGATNDFFNFVEDSFFDFQKTSDEGISLAKAWQMYLDYSKEANVPYPMSKMRFKDELKSYFREFIERKGNRVNLYFGFKEEMFEFSNAAVYQKADEPNTKKPDSWLYFNGTTSPFDEAYPDIPAQYCKLNESGKPIPIKGWDYVTTTLKDIDTHIVHFCRPPENLIVIDFDCKDENGEKNLAVCLKEAADFLPTYAEVSQGGQGLHLYYIFDGEVERLEDHITKDIEIKTHLGKRALRRKLSMFNDLKIAKIFSGLPLKEKEKKMYDEAIFEGEQKLRAVINKNLLKEGPHKDTSSCIDLINKVLNQAYDSGQSYDVRDLRGRVQTFASGSTNQALRCTKVVSNMHFCSRDYEEAERNGGDYYVEYGEAELALEDEKPIVIYDVESYENFFEFSYKIYDPPESTEKHDPQTLEFPTAKQCKDFINNFRLVGFNNSKYDDIMLSYAAQGYTVKELYKLSQDIIKGERRLYPKFKSYADVLDFSSEKKSLKKFEIDLDDVVDHVEMAIPWDKPVPEELFETVSSYNRNDVLATEAVWNSSDRQKDWVARVILSKISGLPVGETNNHHSAALMFGNDKNPQSQFVSVDLSIEFPGYEFNSFGIDKDRYIKDIKGKPIFTTGKSIYLGMDPSEGGFAWGKPGSYGNVKAFDVASMHPSTMIALNLFGDKYTARLKELVDLRKALKRGNLDLARKAFDGKLVEYLDDPVKLKGVANALKIVINSIYGLTAAHFPNPFKDERNVDNVVAKRGALFMIGLKKKVEDLGYTVVHCKTDCIKVADVDDYISNFIIEEGLKYGYEFEVEHWFDKLFIANKAAYIGRLKDNDGNLGDWVAVADEFKEPYVYKTLFSGETPTFKDVCQTKSVKTAMYLDMNEDLGEMDATLVKEMSKLATKIKKDTATAFDIERYDELCQEEAKYHNYIFVGRVGSFVPIEPGYGGGILVRKEGDGMNSVESTKGYRWLESNIVKGTELEKHIDMSYYRKLCQAAIDDISAYCDFNWFISDEKYVRQRYMNPPETQEFDSERLPFV